MSKSKLEKAIQVVNNRYANGQNDDDQVRRMCAIDKRTKGHSFMPRFDTYELCTDEQKFYFLCEKYGYWSEEVCNFNVTLCHKGGGEYMKHFNNKYLAEQKGLR